MAPFCHSRPLLIAVVILGLAAVLVVTLPEVPAAGEPGVRTDMPARIGRFRGERILYCQNLQCLRTYSDSDHPPTNCLSCGAALDEVSPAERMSLPPDTRIFKRRYTDGGGRLFYVSVVLTGADQRSIHRPQQCLPAQGYVIARSRRLSLPEGARPLEFNLLEVRDGTAARREVRRPLLFAYWYVGLGRETPSNGMRLLWTATDRLFHRQANPWAYVAVLTDDGPGAEEQLKAFLVELRAALVRL